MQALAWVWWQPERALPWVYAAMGAQQQGNLTQAAAYLQRIPDTDPQAPESLLALVDFQFNDLNKPFEAEATCQRILRIDPTNGEAHRRLIFFYGMTLQRQKMARQARQAIERDCDIPDTYVHLLGADWLTFSNAYELNGRWLQNNPDNEMLLVARALHYVGAKALDSDPGAVLDESGAAKIQVHEKVLGEYLVRFPRNLELLSYFLEKTCVSTQHQPVSPRDGVPTVRTQLPLSGDRVSRRVRHRQLLASSGFVLNCWVCTKGQGRWYHLTQLQVGQQEGRRGRVRSRAEPPGSGKPNRR
jgi:tetratricopeptide (TPR) repeat protein